MLVNRWASATGIKKEWEKVEIFMFVGNGVLPLVDDM